MKKYNNLYHFIVKKSCSIKNDDMFIALNDYNQYHLKRMPAHRKVATLQSRQGANNL